MSTFMPSKLKTAKTLLFIYGIIQIVVAGLILLIFSFIGSFAFLSSDSDAWGAVFVGIFGAVICLVILGIGIFHIVTARAVANKKSWSKVATIILGILMLCSFPLGTIFGIFILIGIFDDQSNSWFETHAKIVQPQGKTPNGK